MSHEGIRAFDHRSSAEIEEDRKREFRKEAEKQLIAERRIHPGGRTNQEFVREVRKINIQKQNSAKKGGGKNDSL